MRGLLLWEAFLTSLTSLSASLSLGGLVPSRDAAFVVIISQALNAGTIVYKTGQWNPNPGAVPAPPTIVVQGQHSPPPE